MVFLMYFYDNLDEQESCSILRVLMELLNRLIHQCLQRVQKLAILNAKGKKRLSEIVARKYRKVKMTIK